MPLVLRKNWNCSIACCTIGQTQQKMRAIGIMTAKPMATTKAGPLKMPSQSGMFVS